MESNRKVAKYIERNCANYAGGGLCHLETSESGSRLCPFFHDLGRKCNYAEQSVIPGDVEIEAIYSSDKKGEATIDYCERCKKPFNRTSPRQIRCKSCADIVRKNKRRIYNADYRNRSQSTND